MNDELYSVLHYSSRGAGSVVTTYSNPNNHIFANLINSLLPDAHSVYPLRERLLSMTAVVATVRAL